MVNHPNCFISKRKGMKNFSIGIDVSKEKFDLTVKKVHFGAEQSEFLHYDVYENNLSGFRKMLKAVDKATGRADKSEWLFCLETTGAYELHLCNYLYAKGYDVWRESALQIKMSNGVTRSKNDRVDSDRIADYAIRHMDKMVIYVPVEEKLSTLKSLFLYRDRLVKEKQSKHTSSQEIKCTHVMNDEMRWMHTRSQQDIARLNKEIKECEDHIQELIASSAEIEKNYKHIMSIKGMGIITTTALIICTHNFATITSARKASSYCGVAPFFAQSGSSISHKKNVSHYSNAQLKAILTQAAFIATRYNEDIAIYYNRLREKGKPLGVCVNNVRNKLLRIAFSLVQNDCDYEEKHEWRRSQLYKDAA